MKRILVIIYKSLFYTVRSLASKEILKTLIVEIKKTLFYKRFSKLSKLIFKTSTTLTFKPLK